MHIGKDCEPFRIGQILDDTDNFIHVFDDSSYYNILSELDTVRDFVGYLNARQELLTQKHVLAESENDIYRFCQRLILGIEERESCLIPANATIAIYCYCFPERSTCPIQIIVPSEGKCLQIIVKLSNLNIRKFLI